MYNKDRLSLLLLFGLLAAQGCSISAKKSTMPEFDKQGHRGARGLMPENTIPAMLKAIDLGVTTLEMDVVISRDRQVVVSHDPYFNPMISTKPDGSFLKAGEEKKTLLYNMTYSDIRRWDVGLKPHTLFPKQEKRPAYKPLLTDLIDSVESYVASHRGTTIRYNIETKCSPQGDGIRHPDPETFTDLLMEVVRKKNIHHRTTIQSFDIRTLQVLHKKYPEMTTSYLLENKQAGDVEGNIKKLGFVPAIYSPEYRSVTVDMIRICHEKGMRILPWTVNDATEIRRLKSMGVDGIISDYPDLFDR